MIRILFAILLLTVSPALAAEVPHGAAESAPDAAAVTNTEAIPAAAEAATHTGSEAHPPGAHAVVHPPKVDWSFDGMFGTYDRASLQRGLKVYREVCSACHGLKRVYFRHLTDLGYNEGQVKNIASQYTITDGPDDEGEMFERPGLPSDHFASPYKNDNAAKASNNGALPPDLSLIVKARHDGSNYLHGILTGYEAAPAGTILQPGQSWNKYMPGHVLAMPPPLIDGQVAYEDEAPQTVDQYAKDVTHFLTWASEPSMEHRKRTGIKVLIFLAAFAALMYAVKRRLWANVH